MNKKIINNVYSILIIVLVIICIFLVARLFYLDYIDKVEIENDLTIDFTTEVMQGLKSLDDINNSNINQDIKDYLIKYYKDNFYMEDEKILIYEDIKYVNSNKEKIAEIQLEYGEDILNENSPYFSIVIDDSMSEEEKKITELSLKYIDVLRETVDDRVIEENNNLYILASELKFNNLGYDIVVYKGLRLKVYKDSLEKETRYVRSISDRYTTMKLFSCVEDSVVFKNAYGDKFNIKCKYMFGKIKEVVIE